jgi:hypothetical protein
MVVEELLLKKRNLPPLKAALPRCALPPPPPQVVGMEGLWGAGLSALLVLPVLYFLPPSAPIFFRDNALDGLRGGGLS